jgi:hypothetical protein
MAMGLAYGIDLASVDVTLPLALHNSTSAILESVMKNSSNLKEISLRDYFSFHSREKDTPLCHMACFITGLLWDIVYLSRIAILVYPGVLFPIPFSVVSQVISISALLKITQGTATCRLFVVDVGA